MPFSARLLPGVDAGDDRLHLRAPTGTRIEETASSDRSVSIARDAVS
jgi:hypothetical protein